MNSQNASDHQTMNEVYDDRKPAHLDPGIFLGFILLSRGLCLCHVPGLLANALVLYLNQSFQQVK